MNFLMRTEARTKKRTIRGRKAKKNLWNIMWNFFNLISGALALTFVVLKTVCYWIMMYLWPHYFVMCVMPLVLFMLKVDEKSSNEFNKCLEPRQRSFLTTITFAFVLAAVY